MLTINQLMKYLRTKHSIIVKSSQSRALRNMGYYHGFKGYRFIRTPNQKIQFASLDEVIALNKFDMRLKALFYPKVMFIENALKSYVIEATLNDAKSENWDVIFNRSMTHYRSYSPGSDDYKKQYAKRMMLKGKINSALIRDYEHNKQTVKHFFNADRVMPIWAIFESLTLGEFGSFFSCANSNVKRATSSTLQLPSNLDADGKITEFIIYAIKDLRNAVAHNNIVFDTRFRSGNISKRLVTLLESEIGIVNLDFMYIHTYVILLTYILRKMGESKTNCKQFVNGFITLMNELGNELPISVCNQILGTQKRKHLAGLQNFISKS